MTETARWTVKKLLQNLRFCLSLIPDGLIMNPKNDDREEPDSIIKEYAPYLGLGLQLAITVAVMVFLGLWLDGKFNTSPLLTIICSSLGVFAALYNFIKTVLKSGK